MRDWLVDYLRYGDLLKHEAPTHFHLWVGLSVLAASLERKVWTRISTKSIYPNMFIVLVAKPGVVRKGSTIDLCVDNFLTTIENEINLGANTGTKEAMFSKLIDSQNTVYINDNPYIHSSLTVISKELGSFIRQKDEGFIERLCDLYDCDDKKIHETIGRGEERAQGLWLNILGATVPPGCTDALSPTVLNSGLGSRFIFLHASDTRCDNINDLRNEETNELEEKLKKELKEINQIKGEYKLTEKALILMNNWYKELKVRIRQPLLPTYFQSFLARKHTHVAKVSMCIAASKRNELIINEIDIAQAISCLDAVEKQLPQIFTSVGKSIDADSMQTLISIITFAGDKGITRDNLYKEVMWDIDGDSFKRAIEMMVLAKVIRLERTGLGKDIVTFFINKKEKE